MKVGLLIIGNEVLEGKISDANTRHFSQFLRSNHLELKLSLTVSDEEESIHTGLKALLSLCDVVVTSGGLGPTRDDITKESIASYFGKQIQFSQSAFEVAQNNYQRFNRPFAGKEHGYCFLPEGFIALDNSTGFAPSLYTENGGKYLLCGPGVPKEFKSLLEDHFLFRIEGKFPKSNHLIESVTARTKRVPEEKIFSEVDPDLWDKLSKYGTVSSLPNVMGVDIGVKIKAASPEELEEKKQKVLAILEASPVNEHIWQIGNLSLEESIVALANKKGITYGFAESCTGGLCSHRITNVSGSSKTFVGSIISYAESVKLKLLNVEASTLKNHSDVSIQTAGEMSSGAAQQLRTKIAVSITGIAGPGGGTPEKPVGTVCFGVTINGRTHTHTAQFPGDREQLKLRFSQAALYYLLEELEKIS